MNKNPKFSIIIPVYKAETFIGKCIERIQAQTVNDYELILVNDGSPDRSGEICDEYAKNDNRIKVIHKVNGGASYARNIGLDNATGDIICFADCDDILENTFLENYGDCDSDITIQGYYCKSSQKEEQYIPIEPKQCTKDDIKDLIDILHNAQNTGYLWTRAYKRHIIEKNSLRLNCNYKLREDEEFIWKYMNECKTFKTINKGAYHYDKPDFSTKYNSICCRSDFECTTSIIESTALLLGSYNHPHIIKNINRLASIILKSYKKNDFNIIETKYFLKIFCKYYKKVAKNKHLNIKSKITYYIIGTYTPKPIHQLYNIFLK